MQILASTQRGAGNEIQLTDGIATLLERQQVLAYQFKGTRYDCGCQARLPAGDRGPGAEAPGSGGPFRRLAEGAGSGVSEGHSGRNGGLKSALQGVSRQLLAICRAGDFNRPSAVPAFRFAGRLPLRTGNRALRACAPARSAGRSGRRECSSSGSPAAAMSSSSSWISSSTSSRSFSPPSRGKKASSCFSSSTRSFQASEQVPLRIFGDLRSLTKIVHYQPFPIIDLMLIA